MNNRQKDLVARLMLVEEHLRSFRADALSLRSSIQRLEELQLRPSFVRKSQEKRDRHNKRLAVARTQLRDIESRLNAVETEISRMNIALEE